MNYKSDEDAIDAVITWVDGSDPAHRMKREAAKAGPEIKQVTSIAAGLDNTRFCDNGELLFCLASIRKFLPWIRRIFLITDNQVPAFLSADLKKEWGVTVVDHNEIFESYSQALPTFNSRSIETVMWRIPGLAPKFLYLNDDFVLLKPLSQDEFFRDGSVVLRGNWKPIREVGRFHLLFENVVSYLFKRFFGITRTMHLMAQKRGALLAGFKKKYFRVPHLPHPMLRETLETFFDFNEADIRDNIRFKFRDTQQFWPISLSDHLEIANDNAVFAKPEGYISISAEYNSANNIRATLASIEEGKYSFLCLAGIEKLNSDLRGSVDKALKRYLELN